MAEVGRQLAPMQDWLDAVNATDNTAAHAHASSVGVAIDVNQVAPATDSERDRVAATQRYDAVGASQLDDSTESRFSIWAGAWKMCISTGWRT